jgi:hypothetical protein
MLTSFILQERARAVLIPDSTHFRFKTGKVPGVEASSSATEELIGSPKLFRAPEKSFELVAIWAWISSPMTLFHLWGN